jgi:hypothetical protein
MWFCVRLCNFSLLQIPTLASQSPLPFIVLLPSSAPFVDCCTSTCTCVDTCSSTSTMFSSPAFFYIVYASKFCYFTTWSSSNSSMNIESTNVAPSLVCFLTLQHLLFFCKNLNVDVPVVSISWIIVYTNYYFSLYAFPSTHSKDDDECGGDLIANG